MGIIYIYIKRERERELLPMNSNTIVSLIMDIYIHSIPFCHPNHWAWKASIYDQHALAAAQPRKVGLLQLHIIYTYI